MIESLNTVGRNPATGTAASLSRTRARFAQEQYLRSAIIFDVRPGDDKVIAQQQQQQQHQRFVMGLQTDLFRAYIGGYWHTRQRGTVARDAVLLAPGVRAE